MTDIDSEADSETFDIKQVNALVSEDVARFFRGKKINSFVELIGGHSGAKMAKFEVEGKSYVARCSGSIKGLRAVEQEFCIQKLASDYGLAPEIIGFDLSRGLIIMKFIHSVVPPQTAPHE